MERATLHAERYRISVENAARMRAACRLVAVGTMSVGTIQTALRTGRESGETDIFIYPGFEFRGVGAMLTNFHLPRTSLLLLSERLRRQGIRVGGYRHAVEARYRFYSYGDCMLIV